jgi:hypothetical protein
LEDAQARSDASRRRAIAAARSANIFVPGGAFGTVMSTSNAANSSGSSPRSLNTDGAPPDDHREFIGLCQAIGYVVVHWSIVEQQLDQWVSVAFDECGGKNRRRNGDIPTAFKQKRSFFNGCLRNIPLLESFKDEGLALTARMAPLAKTRNNLMHSAIGSLQPEDWAFEFRLIGYGKDVHTVQTWKFTLAQWPKLERSLSDLVTDSIRFSQRLADKFRP